MSLAKPGSGAQDQSNGGPQGHWTRTKTFLVVTTGEVLDIYWIEARDAANCHGMAP